MRLSLGSDRIPMSNISAETVFRRPNGEVQRHIASAAEQRFPQHRQDMGTDIEDHAVRMTQPPGIQFAGGKVKRDRFSDSVKAAWLLQIAFYPGDILR